MNKPDQPPEQFRAAGELTFPVVGIGASAGGFQALATLLQNLPAAPGMAFVVILHLPRDQHSSADRVLQGSTGLPVVQVNHSMPILPDHVYVIPPGCGMEMRDGALVLRELDNAPGDPVTIDVFFRTLALAHREKAIAVVLSGMGSDGTAGLARIKEQGGVTIVQLPADAEATGMPRSAIDSGMADFVMTAAQIPAKLLDLCGITQAIRLRALHGNAPAEVRFDMGPEPQQTLDDVLALLRERTGHDFHQYKQATLLRRLERRLQVRGVADLPAYRDLQRQDASESHALLKDLLIGVTQFFRDRAAFAALEREVLPQLLHGKRQGDTVRVWVAACSTGEEAYSVAMLLADAAAGMEHPPSFQVFASDIDAHAIRTARAGLYPASIANDVPPDRLRRYFTMENGGFRVRKGLREQILFAEHNLLQDPAFSGLDLVTCRNFLIYLNREMYRQVLATFHFALHPGGCLMLGSAETAEEAAHLFAPVDAAQRLYQSSPAPQTAPRTASVAVRAVEHALPAIGGEAPPVAHRARLFSFAEIHANKAAEQAPPSILVNGGGEIVHIAERASRYLRHVGGEPTRDLVALVVPELALDLRTALFQAKKSGRPAATGPVRYQQGTERCAVDVTVLPFEDEHADGALMLVSFAEVRDLPARPPVAPNDRSLPEQLDEELRQTRRKLLETIDEAERSTAVLRTRIEELQTTVEELCSANEELETGKEELRSTNEEYRTVIAELKRRLDSLGKAHDDLNNLIASSDVTTLFLDSKMRILRYTPRVTDLFNVIPADVGRPLLHITSRVDNARLAEDSQRVFETLQPLEQEVRSKDGRDYIVRVHPYRTEADRIDGAVMTFFDITSRRAAEAERTRAERRAEAILEHMGDAHSALDRDYRIVGVNVAAERLVGRPRAMLLGRSHWDAFPASVDAPVGLALRRVVEEGIEQHLTHHYVGEGLDMHLEVDAYPTEEGGVAMFWRNVTERVRAEQALRASEEKYRALFNEMDEAYAIVEVMADDAGRWTNFLFLEVNQAFMRHTGMPYPVGRTATQLLGTPNPRWAQLYGQAADTGVPIRLEEGELTLGRVFDLNIFRLGGEDSRRVAVLFTDITARKKAEARLRDSEERYRTLFDSVTGQGGPDPASGP